MSFVLIGFQFKELETLNCEWVFCQKLSDGLNKVLKKIFVKKKSQIPTIKILKCPPHVHTMGKNSNIHP